MTWPTKKIILGCRDRSPLLSRWVLLRSRFGNLYLHCFHRNDEDRELHDHPWTFVSLLLWPGYVEETPRGRRRHWPGELLIRPAEWAHRVELVGGRLSWSLVWVFRKRREWGFYLPDRWVSWRVYGLMKGCGEDEG